MTNLENVYGTQLLSGTVTYNMKEFENGVLAHEVNSTLTHTHNRASLAQTGLLEVKLVTTISAITGTVRLTANIRQHAIIIKTKVIEVTTTGTFILVVVINQGGIPRGNPTYFEELSKLDQFSKAQYIPHDRR